MALFDSIGGYLGARSARKTAKKGRQYMEGQLDTARDNITDQLEALLGEGGTVSTLYGQSREDLTTGVNEALNTLLSGYDSAISTVQNNRNVASDLLSPYSTQGAAAYDMYNKALLGGEGAAEAFQAFQNSTGYNSVLNEALQATQRQYAASGMSNSGNVLTALQDRATSLATQSFSDYMSNLFNSSQLGLQAAGTQASLEQGITELLANLQTGKATGAATLQTGLAESLSNLGVSQAALESNLRSNVISNEYGLANSALGMIGDFYGFEANAKADQGAYIGSTLTDLFGGGGSGGSSSGSGGGSIVSSLAALFAGG